MALAGNYDEYLQDELRRLRENIEELNKGEECIYVPARLKKLCKGFDVSKSLDAVKTLAINLPDIVNPSDPRNCIIAVIESTLPFVALAGPKGALTAYVLGILAHLIGKSDGPSLTHALNAALDQCRTEGLEDRAQGVICQFSQNIIDMCATKTMDNGTLVTLFHYKDHGVEFLGELYSFLRRKSKKAISEAEAHEVLELVQLFCQLTLARILMLQQLLELIRLYKPDYAPRIKRILDELYKQSKIQLDFLSAPATNQVFVAAFYIASEWPEIKGCLELIGARSENGFDFSSLSWTIKSGTNYLRGFNDVEHFYDEVTFGPSPYALKIKKVEQKFYVIQSYKNKLYLGEPGPMPGWYVFAPLDDATHLIILRTRDGKFLISKREAPCSFLYHGFGWGFSEGDPGEQGYLKIEEV